jgi:hypothetical protein
MRKALMLVGVLALAATLSPTGVLAKGKSGGSAKGNDHGVRGLARADEVAGSHGLKGRNVARTRGANKNRLLPPGAAKEIWFGQPLSVLSIELRSCQRGQKRRVGQPSHGKSG